MYYAKGKDYYNMRKRKGIFMIFYQRLRDLRIDNDKSQAEIAKIIGTSQSYYAQYENGKRNIPFERIIILAKYYNVSLDYIAGFTDTPRKIK